MFIEIASGLYPLSPSLPELSPRALVPPRLCPIIEGLIRRSHLKYLLVVVNVRKANQENDAQEEHGDEASEFVLLRFPMPLEHRWK